MEELRLTAQRNDTDMLIKMFENSLYILNWQRNYLGTYDDPSEIYMTVAECIAYSEELERRGVDISTIEPHRHRFWGCDE